jgi:DNA helicase-2/ATP-dependent DNA helicase PcrA
MSFLDGLNEPQQQAVEDTEGPMMIIAGAGSGKTRVLTYRIANLIGNGVDAFNILSLTFTNKAAKEMRTRIEKIVGNEAKSIWMGTFHSVFAKILRIEAEKIGYNSNFTIYDSDDSKSLIRTIVKEMNLDEKLYKDGVVLSRISSAKNNLISWRDYAANPQLIADDNEAGRPQIAAIYKEYALRSFKANAMDFDDILFNTNVLLHNHLDVLNKYQHKFKYVLIDEFQDTNRSQYVITKKLAAVHQNICVVGDDAQSIYAFRGANIQNILNFSKDYDGVKVIKLEQNYRSTKNIVGAANSIISQNKGQLKKDVWTSNEKGEYIDLIKATSDIEEGRLIATSIFENKMKNGLQNKDFAVLYRTNSQSRSIEEALRRLNIRYKLVGGISFYQRKEVKDMIAYLRFTVNPSDEEAFKRIINYPKRGIGDTTVEKIILKANEQQKPIWEIVKNIKMYFGNNRVSSMIEDFAVMIQSFQLAITSKDAYEATLHIAKGSTLLTELYNDKTVEGKIRYDNLQELLNAVKSYTDDPELEDKSIETFLQQVALITSSDEVKDDDAVTLMTIHMSKGLEFKHVYIAGLEENLFPSQMMMQSREDLEEERRLFYVAVTRAEKKLTLSYAIQRYRYGKLTNCEPSRFLSEIDSRFLNTVQANNFGGSPQKQGFTKQLTAPPIGTPVDIGKTHQPTQPFIACKPNELKVGLKVEHVKFGFGKVASIENVGGENKVTVVFELYGVKNLMMSFAKLMIHPSDVQH